MEFFPQSHFFSIEFRWYHVAGPYKKVCPQHFFDAYTPSPYCISLHQSRLNYDSAKSACKQKGGQLLEYHTPEEAEAISDYVLQKRLLTSGKNGWFYIGAQAGEVSQ